MPYPVENCGKSSKMLGLTAGVGMAVRRRGLPRQVAIFVGLSMISVAAEMISLAIAGRRR
jgi:hypothetical protein